MTPIRACCGLVCVLLAALGTNAEAGQAESDGAQVDAVRCWRRVDRNAIQVGQPFSMTLTCRMVETELGRAAPDLVGLEPETIDLPPFEVLDGERFPDVVDGSRRLFQYRYTLQLVSESHFGEDVVIPPIALNYRIERRTESGAALPGRELVYVLPTESIRVLSLVPDGMQDIRGVPVGTLGAAAQRRFRADMATLVAVGLAVVAVGLLLVGFIRTRRSSTASVTDERPPVPNVAVARAALRELTSVSQVSAVSGWSPELTTQALAALRLSAAVSLQQPVAERATDANETPRDGEVRVRAGLLGRRTAMVSSSVTPADVTRTDLAPLRHALATFSAARYGADGEVPVQTLTQELENGIAVTRPLRILALMPVQRFKARASAAREWWPHRWAR